MFALSCCPPRVAQHLLGQKARCQTFNPLMALGVQGGDKEEQAQPLQSADKMGKGPCLFRPRGFGSSAPGNLVSRLGPEWIWGFILTGQGAEPGTGGKPGTGSSGRLSHRDDVLSQLLMALLRTQTLGDISQPQRCFWTWLSLCPQP